MTVMQSLTEVTMKVEEQTQASVMTYALQKGGVVHLAHIAGITDSIAHCLLAPFCGFTPAPAVRRDCSPSI